jgi:quercetin dioxygenase-like cupin family protein
MTTQQPPTNADPLGVLITRAGEGERFIRENRVVTIRLDLPQLSVHEIEFDTTFEVAPHSHAHVDATIVLDGEIELLGDEEPRRVGPGTIVAAPPGVRHGFRNPGPGRARILALHAPDGGFAARVRGT